MKKKLKPENEIQRDFIKLLKRRGAWCFKTIRSNRKGIPDLICCYKGFFFAIEVKKEGVREEGASPLQKLEIKDIKEAQGFAICTSMIDEVEEILNKIDDLMVI